MTRGQMQWTRVALLAALGGLAVAWAGAASDPGLALQHEFSLTGYRPHQPFVRPAAVAYDRKRQRLWVADAGANEIVAVSTKGVPLYRFQHFVDDGRGGKMPGEPCAIVVDRRGRLLVTDQLSDQVDTLDVNGRILGALDVSAALGDDQRAHPRAMTLDAQGRLYVVESGTMQVLVFDARGRLLRTVGSRGEGEGQFEMLADVAVDQQGRLYALDSLRRSPVVQVFDADGQFVEGFGRHGHDAQDFHFPVSIAIDADGRVWIADAFSHEVKAFALSGEFLAAFGGMGQGEGQFFFPADLDSSGDGRLFVAERGGRRVQALRATGSKTSRGDLGGTGGMPRQ